MKSPRAALFILLCLSAAAAAPGSAPKQKKTAPAPEASADPAKPNAEDCKKRIENYLAQRTKKLQDAHAARLEFASRETLLWEEFWGKDRAARKTFELRTARQALDLFSMLETLDPKDHAATIANFETLRANMVKSFEVQQRQKMQDFFVARDARSKQFADAQERDRAAFAADAEASWQSDKNYFTSIYSPAPLPGSTPVSAHAAH